MLLAASLPLQSGTAFSPVLLFAFARLTDTPAPTNWTKGGAGSDSFVTRSGAGPTGADSSFVSGIDSAASWPALLFSIIRFVKTKWAEAGGVGSDSFVTRSGAGPTGADSSFVSGIDSAASWPALLFSIIRFVKTKWAEAGGVGSDSFVTRSGAGATGADSFVEGEESVACLSTGPAFWPALLFSIIRFVKTKWAEAGGVGSDSFVTRSGAGATGADSFVEGEESVACLSTGPAFWPALLFSIIRFVKTKWAEAGGVGSDSFVTRSGAGPTGADSSFVSGIDSAASWPALLFSIIRFVKTKWAEAGGVGSDSFVTRSGAGATGADSFVEGEESVACLST